MNDRRDDLLDEAILRRALRLEADEPLPRFDAEAIAALAERRAPTTRLLVSGIVAAAVTGLAAAGIWSLIIAAAPTLADDAMSALLGAVVTVATLLVPIAQVAAEPAVPLSLLAALGVAILYELHERGEQLYVHTS